MRVVMRSAVEDGGRWSRMMRVALARRVHANGLRATAREMGVTPSALERFVSARVEPSRPMLRKLRRSYLRVASE